MKTFVRGIVNFFWGVFGLKASVHTNVPRPADPDMLPAIVPPVPTPILKSARVKSKRPKDLRIGLKCTQVGDVVVIECGDRFRYRAVTRAVDKISSARRTGLDHCRHAHDKNVIVLRKDLPLVHQAMGGASYRELRTSA